MHGFPTATCRFQAEPGEYRLLFEQIGELVKLQVLEFASSFSKASNSQGTLIFEGTESAGAIAREVKRQYDKLLYLHGMEGYENLWGHEFPIRQLTRLKESFITHKSRNY